MPQETSSNEDRYRYRSVSDIQPAVSAGNASWPPKPLQDDISADWRPEIADMDDAVDTGDRQMYNQKGNLWYESVLHVYPREENARYLKKRPYRQKRSPLGIFLTVAVVIVLILLATIGVLKIRETVESQGGTGFDRLLAAAESFKDEQYGVSANRFKDAYDSFLRAESSLTFVGRAFASISEYLPFLSKISSGHHAIEAGQHFAMAGMQFARVAADISLVRGAVGTDESVSLLNLLSRIKAPLEQAALELESASLEIDAIALEDIPEDKREKFSAIKDDLPMMTGLFRNLKDRESLIEELMGGHGPRKYLFLMQNNHEMRATGGFIGTYGLLDVNDGVVRKFFVDGIFNPDGQLRENIVPPRPIRKISAAWSLHDSNWFPDFPVSAEKAIFFYEKTGGPTVDGVIALTPTVMEKLLEVVGPITLTQYGITVDANNFMPVIQEQVEVKYDKKENKPKKVLADLSTELLEEVFASHDKERAYRIAQALVDGLNQKHILLYARHPETEELIDSAGWSGRVLDTKKDYLSIIHSNINGYKTDGIIDETIRHKADIQADGSVIDTVTITRKHNGGDTPYDWWNKVSADYLRVYVPKGSELISAKGATWEFPNDPIDYERLGFRRDLDIEQEESSMRVDEPSGTRISEDAGKTVFGAWVYVSPKESVTVEYRYRLPFRISIAQPDDARAYSVVYQKQSGSKGSKLFSNIVFPDSLVPVWQTGPNLLRYGREFRSETDLRTDRFVGMVFSIRL